ncbi:MAG TPA: amidohydrolase family protein [Actinomycetota bacterium]
MRAPLAWIGPGKTLHRVTLMCEAGRITWIGTTGLEPPADQEIEVDGFLMPAVADRHVHIGLADPAAVLMGGVAAVRDLAWPADVIFEMADASELPTFNGPLIRAVGPMLTGPGGYPTGDGWAPPGTALELHGVEEAVQAVETLADRGAAAVKVSLNAVAGPTPTDAELSAVVEAALRRGIPVTAHAEGKGQVERALGAGVNELAHTPWTEKLSDGVIEALARTTRIVSTLDIWSYGQVTPELRAAAENLARFRAAGGTIVYGTDLGNGPIPPGIDVREAMLLHETVGLSTQEVLGAMVATSLEVGAPADLIATAADPLEDLRALAELKLVLRSGRVVSSS